LALLVHYCLSHSIASKAVPPHETKLGQHEAVTATGSFLTDSAGNVDAPVPELSNVRSGSESGQAFAEVHQHVNSSTVSNNQDPAAGHFTPRSASPAVRLSSRQKLFRPQRPPVEAPATPSASAVPPAASNPFSPPPPPPLGTPRTGNSSRPVAAIQPRLLSPAAMALEVRVLEYMENRRHGQSPSENLPPNFPAGSRFPPTTTAMVEPHPAAHSSPGYTSITTSAQKQLSTPATTAAASHLAALHDALVSFSGEEVARAVLDSKRAIDLATEEVIQRLTPSKAKKIAGTPGAAHSGSPVALSSSPLYGAFSGSQSASPKEVSPILTPARPSLLPQRSRPSSAQNSASKGPVRESSPQLSQAHQQETTPVKAATARPGSSTTKSSAQKMPVSHSAHKGAVYSPPTQGTAVPRPPAPSLTSRDPPRDLLWLLEHLKPSTPVAVREEASKELKRSIKSADDVFWQQNCAQVNSVYHHLPAQQNPC
jgi:hypothetical protein